jgi:formylglycine-generating enzyme required for sulfatase activity
MIYNNYAHIELNITSKTKNTIGNSANYKNLARWNDSEQGNVTSVGSNGNSSFYGLYDTSGQVYEWTDDSDIEQTEFKICRGGCYADTKPFNISKEHRQKFHFNSMLSDGFFGFRVATLNNPNSFNNFISIANTGNAPDKCDENLFGIVNYNYQINRYLVTNNEYCEFLNDADPNGSNLHFLYDVRMGTSAVGGILLVDCEESGSKYVVKPNMSNKPVTFIKWIMAAKYINWLHANKSSSPINHLYSGAYNLTNVVENLSITAENSEIILSEDSDTIVTDQLFSILSDNNLSINISREPGATYFLPNEDEWYKAAYYDPTIQSYWKYGTKNNTDPLAVIPNITGSGQYVEGYHYSVKKFPILVSKLTNGITSLATENNSKPLCPSISTSITSGVNAGIYFINHTVSGLIYGSKYKYDFSSSVSNWPCKISPLSGEFIAYSNDQEINAILEFCPKNYQNISVCDSNINYIFNSSITNNYYVELSCNVASDSCPQASYITNLINTTGLPTISNDLPYLNIDFLDSHNNSIILKDNLCCNPIPLVLAVKNHEPAQSYTYNISSSSNKILLSPSSGIVSFGKGIGKITSYALGLNNKSNISILTATLQKSDDPSSVASNQILLQCVGNCEKGCDNHANFANKALWGSCPDNTCPDRPNKARLVGSVTTVGTNGGMGPYGTYDMDGNIWEIVHAGNVSVNPANYSTRGGSFKSSDIGKNARFSVVSGSNEIGFRIASYSNPFNYPDMVSVQDIGVLPSGNIADTNGFGAVDYQFVIGKYPVTNCEYVEFLNSVASTGVSVNQSSLVYSSAMSGCYGGINRAQSGSIAFPIFTYSAQPLMGNKPVVYLPTNAALRYINWLENNKQNGWNSTINGTYIVNAGNSAYVSGNRPACSKYFLPSENEWYKAAYYKGANTNNTNAGYWDFSTKASLKPDPVSATPSGHGYVGDDCSEPLIKSSC